MSKIVVTGATGRLGANVCKHLSESGHDIVACLLPGDRQEAKLDGLNVSKKHFDITDSNAVIEAIQGAEIVVHTAAVMEGMMDKMPSAQFFDINVKGTFNVLEGIRQDGNKAQLICFSSTAVYDVVSMSPTPGKETDECFPLTLYGQNKTLVETMVNQYHWLYDIKTTLIRPNYIVAGPEVLDIFTCKTVLNMLKEFGDNPKAQMYLPNSEWKKAVADLEANAEKMCIPRCPGDKSWRWHMTDVRDVMKLIDTCLGNDKAAGQTFNVAAADACEWPDFVKMIAEKTGKEYVEVDVPNCWQFSLDLANAREVLGYTPDHNHQSIVDTAYAMLTEQAAEILPGEIAPLSFEAAEV